MVHTACSYACRARPSGSPRCYVAGWHRSRSTIPRTLAFCLGRHTGRTDRDPGDLPYLNVVDVEDAIAREWTGVSFTDKQVAEFSQRARDDLHRSSESGSRLITDQKRRLAELERRREKLLDAYMADALPVGLLSERQGRVEVEIADAKRLIRNAQTAGAEVSSRLERVMELLRHDRAAVHRLRAGSQSHPQPRCL